MKAVQPPGVGVAQLRQEEGRAQVVWEPVRYRPEWVPTANERNLGVAMDVIERNPGKGRLIAVTGPAGYGKTETTLKCAAERECIHLLMWDTWKSPLPFLQALLREHGVSGPPKRTNDCLLLLVERLTRDPRPIFLDEMDLAPHFLNLVRQISSVTAAPFVLVGENALIGQITAASRSWSRTWQTVQFDPVALSDIIFYLRKAAGLEMDAACGAMIHKSHCGQDWRDLERVTSHLVEIANAKQTRLVTEEMVRVALRMTLKGEDDRVPRAAKSPFKRRKP